ncbi:hypothetical protein ABZ958_05180 [Streptomyces sp. NPDC046237]|uniref:hypothetical protein n=1 Tax=Streptomyces sp. NPDC046237 TaxID=3154914 RepID=UPI0033CDAC38
MRGPQHRQSATRRSGPGAAVRSVAVSALLLGVAGGTLTACGASAGRIDGVRDAARAFQKAVTVGDYEAACGLLAPRTREQLVEDEKQRCSQALRGQQLPAGAPRGAVEVYGRQAAVRAGVPGEGTLFLSQFTGGWKVVAAGCTPQGDRPYRCVVKGG